LARKIKGNKNWGLESPQEEKRPKAMNVDSLVSANGNRFMFVGGWLVGLGWCCCVLMLGESTRDARQKVFINHVGVELEVKTGEIQ